MSEQWRVVVGYPDYQVSDLGRVRRATGGKGVRAGRVLRPQTAPNGYRSVQVYRGDGVPTRRTIHTLVYEAFVGPRPPGMEVNHVDGVKANNALTNLEGCTSRENKVHASAAGLSAFGPRNGATRLTDDQVGQIRAECSAGVTQRRVAARFGISQGHVSDIVTGKRRSRLGLAS